MEKALLALVCLAGSILTAWPAWGAEPGPPPADLAARDEYFMAMALDLARRSVQNGNEPFGAVMVKDGQVVARAENTVFSGSGVTRHAEMNLLDAASQVMGAQMFPGCTVYTSTEPCASCASFILMTKIEAVVYSVPHTFFRPYIPHFEGIPAEKVFALGQHQIELRGPVMRAEGEKILTDYIEARMKKTPKP